MSSHDSHALERFCLFRSGASWFALPASNVQEVSFRPDVVAVSPAAPVLAGLCHFRNEFLAVLSLKDLLPEMSVGESSESQVIVIRGDDGPWALLVEEVAALESLDSTSAAEALGEDGWSDVVMAWATYREHAVRILDADAFYRLAADALQNTWAQTEHRLETVQTTV